MERLIELMESRIRRNVYVRFGGEHLKTYHSNMERRWVLSLRINSELIENSIIHRFQCLGKSTILSGCCCTEYF